MTRSVNFLGCCLLSVGLLIGGCSSDKPESEVTPPVATGPNEKVVSFKVTGMTCSNCEGHISNKLASLDNVKEARASRKKEMVWLLVDGDAPAEDAVAAAVEEVAKKQGGKYKLVGKG